MNQLLSALIFLSGIFLPCGMCTHSFTKDSDACDWHQLKSKIEYPECQFKEIDHRLVCFGGLHENWKLGAENVRTLILCEWPEVSFDPEEVLSNFTSLRKFMIANSNLTKFTSAFPPEVRLLEKINIFGTKLQGLPDGVLSSLSALRNIDLRNNALAEINLKAFNTETLHHIYLSGNPLKCTENASWILDTGKGSPGSKISDRDKLRCSSPYEGRLLVPVMEIILALKGECKRTVCTCELVYVFGRSGKQAQKQLIAFNSVNCSHRGLTEMPEFLPANTTTLRLTGNQIKDLKPLAANPVYRSVLDLYVEDNEIESIVELEGSYWLEHFRAISLRGNKLTDIPTYVLENVLLHSGGVAGIYLGNNPWRCDCLFTPGFQELLIRYSNLMKDIHDIKCALVEGDENSNKEIRDLTRTEICISPDNEHSIYPLDVLNVILALLIFLILGKLLYDYWSFKKTGKLPWIVAKIP
ncbi:protein singed wings 2 [Prorops nasuta]|uniref:protein singed wings 2 n=1 Tax=Prorops nasuta TaxID=863751 RepID=UPI0034CD1BED